MYEKYLKIFNNYVVNYNGSDENINYKINHSYRVSNLCVNIAKSLKLSKRDIEIAYMSGLFHDIGRFDQLAKTKSFEDTNFIDHGDLGARILKLELANIITEDKEIRDILISVTKNHNKLEIGEVKDCEKIFCKIVRDADKVDILGHWLTKIDGIYDLNNNILESIYNKKSSSDKVNNDMDMLLRMLGFIYDINYKYSFEFLKKNKIIENRIALIEKHTNSNTNKLKNIINSYIDIKLLT